MACAAADIFLRAAELNRNDARRAGNIVEFEAESEILYTGDIHGHRNNLSRILAYADVSACPQRRLVLQEIIHGPPDERTGQDRSVDLLLRAARLKVAQPEQVVFLLGNHDVAQLTGNEISKNGRGVCKAFTEGVRYAFGASGDEALAAIHDFLRSMPLAARVGRTLMSHSLPSPGRWTDACLDILRGGATDADFRRGGPVYEWTWGRGHTPEHIEQLAAAIGVDFFLIGHYHTGRPFEAIGRRALTVSSDDDHGCLLPFAGATPLNQAAALEALKPIVSLG